MTVSGPVREIRLYYTQGVVTAFSHVHVASDAGAVIPTGKLVNDPSDQQTVIVRLGRALGPGGYSLSWQVTSVDTHRHPGHIPLHGLLNRLKAEAAHCAAISRACHVTSP